MFDKELYRMSDMQEEGDFIPVFSLGDDELNFDDQYKSSMPVLALKNTILFPGVVIPITVGRDKSIKALQKADKADKFLGVLTQRDMDNEDPDGDALFDTGTVARIMKILKMPDGSTTAILQGRRRFMPDTFIDNSRMLEASVLMMEEHVPQNHMEFDAMASSIRDYAYKIIDLSPNIPSDAKMMLDNIKNKGFLINFIASNINLNIDKKQEILAENDYVKKAHMVLNAMNSEIQLLQVKSQIESKVRTELRKTTKRVFPQSTIKNNPGGTRR